ncbi:MAG: hypothetical protein AB7V22_06650 [Kiritimatiellia bacterium]
MKAAGWMLAAWTCGVAAWLAAAEENAGLRWLNGGFAAFGGTSATWRVEAIGPRAAEGHVVWSLEAGGGVLARREQSVRLEPGAPASVDIAVDLPEVRAGVVAEGRLQVALLDENRQPLAELEQPIYVFGRDPAAERKQWLRELDLRLFDPSGETARRLDELGWPYRRIANPAAFAALGGGTLIVGEGCSLRENRGLLDAAIRAAASGARVVVLAPADGAFAPPGPAEGRPGPAALHFRSAEFVCELDKRFDVPPARAAFRLDVTRAGTEVAVVPSGGWAFVEARWGNGGALTLAGPGVLETWESSPVPRHLLVRLLEWATAKQEKEL